MLLNHPRRLAILTVFVWTFGAATAKFVASHSGFALFALSMVVTYCCFQICERRGGAWVSLGWRDLFSKTGLASLSGYGIYWLCYAQSFRSTSDVVLPAALNYTWPLFTVIFSEAFFREETIAPATRRVSWTGMLLGMVGVVIVISRGDLSSFLTAPWTPILWGLCAGASYGFFGAYSSTVPGNRQLHFLTLSSLSGFFFLAPLAGYELLSAPLPSLQIVLITILLSILLEGLGYYTWTRANRLAKEQHLNVASLSSIMYALPFLSTLTVSMLYGQGERLSISLWIGLAFIVLSSAICQHAEAIAAGWTRARLPSNPTISRDL